MFKMIKVYRTIDPHGLKISSKKIDIKVINLKYIKKLHLYSEYELDKVIDYLQLEERYIFTVNTSSYL